MKYSKARSLVRRCVSKPTVDKNRAKKTTSYFIPKSIRNSILVKMLPRVREDREKNVKVNRISVKMKKRKLEMRKSGFTFVFYTNIRFHRFNIYWQHKNRIFLVNECQCRHFIVHSRTFHSGIRTETHQVLIELLQREALKNVAKKNSLVFRRARFN